jgi:MYXO-CTERM domain-containing protein
MTMCLFPRALAVVAALATVLAATSPDGAAALQPRDDPNGAPTPPPLDGAPKPKKCSVAAVGMPSPGIEAATSAFAVLAVAARRRRAKRATKPS